MEPKFQTSFIPKSPITSSNPSGFTKGSTFNILGTISGLIFVVTLLASGGLYGYTGYIQSQIKNKEVKLTQAHDVFQTADNQKIILASDQLRSIRMLLSSHIVISPLFELLQKDTLPTVKLVSFAFNRDITGVVTVEIQGTSRGYASLAQQSKIFSNLSYLKNVEFTNIKLSDSGEVQVQIKAQVDTDVLLYSKKVQALSVVNKLVI